MQPFLMYSVKETVKESPSFIEINKKVVRKTVSKTITCDFQILKSITWQTIEVL